MVFEKEDKDEESEDMVEDRFMAWESEGDLVVEEKMYFV